MPQPTFAVISDEVSQDLVVIRDFVREFGLSGIELRSFAGRAFSELTHADVAAIATVARDEGWKIHACATPVLKCPMDDPAAFRAHCDIFKRSLDVARALDCRLLRIFTFLRQPEPRDAAWVTRVTAAIHDLAEIAAGSGVRIGIENEHSCMVATRDELRPVLDALPESVGAIWDPCNVLYLPDAPRPSAGEVARLGSRLFHVHAKDAVRRSRAGRPSGPDAVPELHAIAAPIGAGEVNWRAQLQALGDSGYTGVISLETHWRRQSIDESLLHLPAGYAFSAGGEEASRFCLRALMDIAC